MVLQSNQSTNGMLYFKYRTVDISDMDLTENTTNLTNDRVEYVSLDPAFASSKPENRRFIWIHSADPVSCFYFVGMALVCDCLSREREDGS